MQPRIESLLSTRLHLSPQIVGDRIYFVSNLSGRLKFVWHVLWRLASGTAPAAAYCHAESGTDRRAFVFCFSAPG